MTNSRQLPLVFTLLVLLIGLSAYAVPAGLVCNCPETPADWRAEASAEPCLVCQLQNGAAVFFPGFSHPDLVSSGALQPASLTALEHPAEILHPPIPFHTRRG